MNCLSTFKLLYLSLVQLWAKYSCAAVSQAIVNLCDISVAFWSDSLFLQSFMCPSGIDDFPMTTIDHIKVQSLKKTQSYNWRIIFSSHQFFFLLELFTCFANVLVRRDCRCWQNTQDLYSCIIVQFFFKCVCQVGLSVLAKYRRPLLVHAEIQQESKSNTELEGNSDPSTYSTYLNTRPRSW